MAIRDRPLLTKEFRTAADFRPSSDSAYVYRTGVEHRSGHVDAWSSSVSDVRLVEITDEHPYHFMYRDGAIDSICQLRSKKSLSAFWQRISRQCVYLDITGLRHHTWAALLRSALDGNCTVIAVYVEPSKYRPSLAPTEGEIYDLSEKISGLAPLPGFASLSDSSDNFCFVPLLGFEGTRVAYLAEQVQPSAGRTIPIIGVPGFMAEYPFITYLGNKSPLLESQAWKQIRFALANCPFALFYALDDVVADFPGLSLKVAPIGTKPHALGTVLYAIAHNSNIEIVYDHPIRKAERTEGTARLMTYHISNFLS